MAISTARLVPLGFLFCGDNLKSLVVSEVVSEKMWDVDNL